MNNKIIKTYSRCSTTGIYGSSLKNKKLKFFDTDDVETFKTYKKKKNTVYNASDIIYSINSLGHRSVETNKLGKEYILFTGCSHTQGIGLPLQETYADIVAKNFNMPYYNLALSGSGNDLIFINISKWLKYFSSKPKLIVIQYTYRERFYRELGDCIELIGPWNFEKLPLETRHNFINYSTDVQLGEESFRKNKELVLNFLSILGIKCIEIPPANMGSIENIEFKILDTARDLLHPGKQSNIILANEIIRKIQTNKLI